MTITLSLPKEWKPFFDNLAASGYNRSLLMLKMVEILKELVQNQETCPGGLPRIIDSLQQTVKQGKHLDFIVKNQGTDP